MESLIRSNLIKGKEEELKMIKVQRHGSGSYLGFPCLFFSSVRIATVPSYMIGTVVVKL